MPKELFKAFFLMLLMLLYSSECNIRYLCHLKRRYVYFAMQFSNAWGNKSIPHDGDVHRTIQEMILECMKILHFNIVATELTLVDYVVI